MCLLLLLLLIHPSTAAAAAAAAGGGGGTFGLDRETAVFAGFSGVATLCLGEKKAFNQARHLCHPSFP